MAPDQLYDDLAAELRDLGRGLSPPTTPDALAEEVMARLETAPAPDTAGRATVRLRSVLRGLMVYRRRVAVAVTALILALLASSPVAATVADWFGFAGVRIEHHPTVPPRATPAPPEATGTLSARAAEKLVSFELLTPRLLGPPRGVEVSADHRVASSSWVTEDGMVRLDQFDGRLDFTFVKRASNAQFTTVAGDFAVWFDEPHEVVVLGPHGGRRTESARLAGHTLIWQRGTTSLRLEGDLDLARAVEIAESVTALR